MAKKLILIHDSEYMIRKTFAIFANESELASIEESADTSTLAYKLGAKPYNAIVLGFSEDEDSFRHILSIRSNMTASESNIPIITMIPEITQANLKILAELEVSAVLLKPTRVKSIQSALIKIFDKEC